MSEYKKTLSSMLTLRNDFRPKLITKWNQNVLEVLAPDSLCCVQVTSSTECCDQKEHQTLDPQKMIELHLSGSNESAFTNYYDVIRVSLDSKFYKDVLVSKSVLPKLSLKVKIFNSNSEGNITTMINQAIVEFLKKGRVNSFELSEFFDHNYYPRFYYFVTVGNKVVENPLRETSQLKDSAIAVYYLVPEKTVNHVKLVSENSVPFGVLKEILDSVTKRWV